MADISKLTQQREGELSKLSPADRAKEEKKQSTYEWACEKYNEQYDNWMPWVEDTFLKYFTKDNRTSYVARDGLDRTKVTNIEQVDKLQDSVNDTAASTLGQGGILQPVGDLGSAAMKKMDPRGKNVKSAPDVTGGQGLTGGKIPGVSALGL